MSDSNIFSLVPSVKAGWQFNNEVEQLLGIKEFLISGKKQLMFFVKWLDFLELVSYYLFLTLNL